MARRELRAARRDRAGDRARPDRRRDPSRASASASSPTRAPSGPTSTWRATSAGAVVVPIYQTNSPEECHWVISDSGACAIVCENEEQLAKIADIRDQLPNLRTIIVIDPPAAGRGQRPGAQALTLERSRSIRCASAARALRSRSSKRAAPACDRRTRSRSSTPPAPPGRRRAACSPTATTARSSRWSSTVGEIQRRRDHLPVPPARALLRAADPAR